MSTIKKHISPATVLAAIAVFLAMAGGAWALGRNSVGSKQLKKNAVITSKIKNRAVTGKKIKLTTLGPVPKVKGHATFRTRRIVATDGVGQVAAREAAPEVKMFRVGPVTIYAKCYTDTTLDRTHASFFIKTARNGVIFDSDEDDAAGDPFLNSATPEAERELMKDYASLNSATVYMQHSDETVAMLPGGRSFEARHSLAAKNGDLPGGNGLYGAGNVCLVSGDLTEYR